MEEITIAEIYSTAEFSQTYSWELSDPEFPDSFVELTDAIVLAKFTTSQGKKGVLIEALVEEVRIVKRFIEGTDPQI